jgi:hypothetical protein
MDIELFKDLQNTLGNEITGEVGCLNLGFSFALTFLVDDVVY